MYADQIHLFESLTDEEAGKVVKHLFRYVNDLNPELPDRTTQLIFEPIKQQLKRDLESWKITISGRSAGGKKSAENRKKAKEIETQFNSVEHTLRHATVNVNVNDNVNVSESVSSNNAHARDFEKIGLEVRKAYADLPIEFTSRYSENFYISWLSINNYLDENCKFLRMWENQLTVSEYKKIFDRAEKKEFSILQAKQALTELDASRQAKDKYNSVFHGFNTFIRTILKNV